MKNFDVYYGGVITIEAETEEEAREEFYRKYFGYGDIDEIEELEDGEDDYE